MAQTMVNFRMDEDLKRVWNRLVKKWDFQWQLLLPCLQPKLAGEKRIPFEVSVDPFYSESNMNYLRSIVADIESGKAKLVEHDLIEE